MGSYKVSRVQEDIKRELSDILRTVKDPRVQGLVSIVKLDLAGDYSHCKVYISSMQGLKEAGRAAQGLKSASGYIRHALGERVKMRRVPELHFIADDSIAHSADISKILTRIAEKEEKNEEREGQDDAVQADQ